MKKIVLSMLLCGLFVSVPRPAKPISSGAAVGGGIAAGVVVGAATYGAIKLLEKYEKISWGKLTETQRNLITAAIVVVSATAGGVGTWFLLKKFFPDTGQKTEQEIKLATAIKKVVVAAPPAQLRIISGLTDHFLIQEIERLRKQRVAGTATAISPQEIHSILEQAKKAFYNSGQWKDLNLWNDYQEIKKKLLDTERQASRSNDEALLEAVKYYQPYVVVLGWMVKDPDLIKPQA